MKVREILKHDSNKGGMEHNKNSYKPKKKKQMGGSVSTGTGYSGGIS